MLSFNGWARGFGSSEIGRAIHGLGADFETPVAREFIWRTQVVLSSAGKVGLGGQMGVQLSEAGSFLGPGEQRLQDARQNDLESIFFVHHLLGNTDGC